ncbi:MAG: FHA domain-containing protein [Anaerolineales bacterium]|nr:FHA domain-containing protein [Anaerolineales bacterium]
MSETSDKPILVITEGEQAGQRWVIERSGFTIGRGGECDLILPERQVSREHVKIHREGDDYYLEDLDSKNGTWVNEIQLKADTIRLRDGDDISIAMAVRMTFVGSEATAPLVLNRLAAQKGRLQLDRDARRVFIGDIEVDPPLSLPQYRLLEMLFDGVGAVRTREEVVAYVWPEAASDGVSEQAIDALVRRLRDRLNEFDTEHQYVVTVRGHGFRLDNPES